MYEIKDEIIDTNKTVVKKCNCTFFLIAIMYLTIFSSIHLIILCIKVTK